MQFNIDSWPWKIAVLVALLGMRQFVHLLAPKDKTSQGSETSKWLVETIDSAAIAIGLVLFVIQPFILQAFYIPSGSMEDTLRISDRLLVSKMVYRLKEPKFQDVVVFKAPTAAQKTSNGTTTPSTDFIKRCMGVPGDQIYIINRQLFRNGSAVPEVYTKWVNNDPSTDGGSQPDILSTTGFSYDMKIVGEAVYSRDYDMEGQLSDWKKEGLVELSGDQQSITDAPYGKVPEGRFLMLGDHRSNSNDGHVWGFVPRDHVVGKAICVFWPPTRLGLVDRMTFFPRKP